MGALVIVATPIGNLSDLSPRALEALRSADLVACEDTRQTLKLLNHFGIRKTLHETAFPLGFEEQGTAPLTTVAVSAIWLPGRFNDASGSGSPRLLPGSGLRCPPQTEVRDTRDGKATNG